MNEDTKLLLEECTSGCKMAINSIKQVNEFVNDENLYALLDSFKNEHSKIEEKASKSLSSINDPKKEPGTIVSTISWFTTETKLLLNNTNHQIAKIMMNGCNMGIQSISKYINQYNDSTKDAKKIALDLIEIEENFMKTLKQYL